MRQKKGNRRRAAYRRGEKSLMFLRRGAIILITLIIIAAAGFGIKLAANVFTVEKVKVSGNYHLDERDVISSSGIRRGESLISLSLKDVEERFRQNAWIREVSLRKQFPDTVSITVKESAPKVLLALNGETFLADERGKVLEKVNEIGTQFLPVINNIDAEKDGKALSEALKLVDALSQKGILEGKESVEIRLEPYGLAMKMDGEELRVGYRDYEKKFERWKALEPEIRKRGLAVEFVDLRFDDVIVQPLIPVKKEAAAKTDDKSKNVNGPQKEAGRKR
ncbi:MAG: FtsQ-type POTRA domain-containing protein [Nitrospirae bacterium]|nr:FtsQ-type POTRA domain-containing protein [Nitrospirota bacterium]